MELMNLGDKNIVLGMRWRSAASASKLERDEWVSKWHSNRFTTCSNSEGTRYSIGVVERTAIDNLPVKRIHSLAAIVNSELSNGIALFSITTIENETLYWGAIYSNGVPEREIVVHESNLRDLSDVFLRLINDDVAPILTAAYPLFLTNIPVEEKDNPVNELFNSCDFRLQPTTFDELTLIIESSKNGVIKSSGDGFSFLHFDGINKKDLIQVAASVVLFAVIAGWFVFKPSPEEMIVVEEVSAPVVVDPNIELRAKAKAAVSQNLQMALLGAKIEWFWTYYYNYHALPDFAFGYRKTQISCAISIGRCETIYKSVFDYKDFPNMLEKLRPLFDTITFTPDGMTVTGVTKIQPHDVYLAKHDIDNLPKFDRGESILGPLLALSSIRPGLDAGITAANTITVDFADSKIKFPKDVESKFAVIGWTASGDYIHQASSVFSKVAKPFVTVDSFEITSATGTDKFKVAGKYVTQKEETQ